MFKHILVPVDLDDVNAAEKAMATAIELARRDGARLGVVSVAPHWSDVAGAAGRAWEDELEAYIAALESDLAIEGRVIRGGSISGGILDMVDEAGVDLVVMASHNPRVTDYLIGSNAAHVVLHAPCSVLVIR